MTGYALASDLKGFASSTLRVRVTRREGDYVWIITADLRDAGTRLVLRASQVVGEEPEQGLLRHQTGLVFLA